MKNNLYLLAVIIALIIATLACGSSNTGEKVGEGGTSPTSAPPKVEVYKVGDIIQMEDHTIVLNSAIFQGSTLKTNFSLKNTGAEEIAVSSLMSFEAKDSEGTKLEQDIFDCGSSFDGTVLPGDKLKGNICWSGATTSTVKIYYTANLFGSGAVVWEITK